jgi:hypothetical protein
MCFLFIYSKLRYPLQPADGDMSISGDDSCVTYNLVDGTGGFFNSDKGFLFNQRCGLLANIKPKH